MSKTQVFGVRDPGRSGGSWLMHYCNVHPAGMRVLGEVHLPSELDFPYPCPGGGVEYNKRVIAFLQSQIDQGVAATGIVKCFQSPTVEFIRKHQGHIIQVIRNPMEVAGTNVYKKKGFAERFLGHPARDKGEDFLACMIYYKTSYEGILVRKEQEPIVRLEDLNRSCGGDGHFFKVTMEYMTQTEFPVAYVKHIQQWYLPAYHYGCYAVKDDGVVVGIDSRPYVYESWRMTWGDDPRPTEYWESWTDNERAMFAEHIGPVSAILGYNYTDRPGYTDVDWALRDTFPWGQAGSTLAPTLYDLDVETRAAYPGKKGLPVFGESNHD